MWQCTCGDCLAQDPEGRQRQQSQGVEQANEAMASLLRDEEVLAGAAFELYASVDVEKPRCLTKPQQTQLTELRSRCEGRLGQAHWSTQVSSLCCLLRSSALCCVSYACSRVQALRRLELMQSYETEGRGTARDKWIAGMESCQAYIDETLARFGVSQARPISRTTGGHDIRVRCALGDTPQRLVLS